MNKSMDLQQVKHFIIDSSDSTCIYIGVDSERVIVNEQWFADYTTAVVVHRDGKRGCKIFGGVTRERDYDQRKDRPAYRLMNEVYKASELYMQLIDAIGDRHCEVHLDINPDLLHGSSCVLNQAVGYIRGTCNIVPMVKPNAFAASYAADRLKEILANAA